MPRYPNMLFSSESVTKATWTRSVTRTPTQFLTSVCGVTLCCRSMIVAFGVRDREG